MLMMHKAKWHKTCYVMCNKTKVDRIRKKIAKEQTPARSTSPLKGRLRAAFPCSSHQSIEKQPIWFFCDAVIEQDYHKAATQKLDASVRSMANAGKAIFCRHDSNGCCIPQALFNCTFHKVQI